MKQLSAIAVFAITSAVMFAGCASDTEGSGELSVNLIVGDIDVTSVSYDLTCDSGFSLSGRFNVNDEQDPPVWAAIMDVPAGDCTIAITAFNDAGDPVCTGSKDFTVVPNETVKVDLVVLCPADGVDPVGNVDIDVTFEIVEGNSCPRLHTLTVIPDEVPPEGSEVGVEVSDADGDTVSTMLTATGGSFGDPSAQWTTYRCDDASGTQTVSVTASDGDPACDKSKSVDVTCPGVDPCEGVTCDDTGNECTVAECISGSCVPSNVDNGTACGGTVDVAEDGSVESGTLNAFAQFCDLGTCEPTMAEANTGVWSANVVNPGATGAVLIKQANKGIGIVQPDSEVTVKFFMKGGLTGAGGVIFAEFFSEVDPEGVSKAEILSGGPLFPTNEWVGYEFTVTTGLNVSNGVTLQLAAICGADPCTVNAYFDDISITVGAGEAGTCQEGDCVQSPECMEAADCPDTGNECTDAVCNAGTCGTSNNTNACNGDTGTCSAGDCVPNDLCAGNTCDDDDTECSDSSCDTGTGQCVATPINEGGDCDGGNGTCDAGVCESSTVCEYEQNFNQLDINGEFIGDGWTFFVNVFNSGGGYKFGYGGTPAPNGPQISALVAGEGGPEQEPQQLSVFSDYDCCGTDEGHKGTDLVETNVFQERPITSDDVGKTLTFTFQAKATPDPFGVGGTTTANGFIKTLVPGPFNESAADRVDTTNLPDSWGSFTVSLVVDGTTVAIGHILQFGFQTNASLDEPSGNFYDNTKLCTEPTP